MKLKQPRNIAQWMSLWTTMIRVAVKTAMPSLKSLIQLNVNDLQLPSSPMKRTSIPLSTNSDLEAELREDIQYCPFQIHMMLKMATACHSWTPSPWTVMYAWTSEISRSSTLILLTSGEQCLRTISKRSSSSPHLICTHIQLFIKHEHTPVGICCYSDGYIRVEPNTQSAFRLILVMNKIFSIN